MTAEEVLKSKIEENKSGLEFNFPSKSKCASVNFENLGLRGQSHRDLVFIGVVVVVICNDGLVRGIDLPV